MANDSWSGQDKAQHFIASAMLSAAGNEYSQHQGMSRDRSAMFGLMFSVSLGGVKKSFGIAAPEGSGWSWKDLARDVAGASTGYTVWQLTRH
ncbi:YfiM family lipoprotein [Escherichia coli]|nr:YfiM family lipoprotein [Escherichia coli]